MNKKAEITFTKVIMAMIIVSLFVAVIGGTYVQMNKYYGTEIDQDFYKSYSRLEKASNLSNDIATEIEKKELGEPSNFVIAASTGISVLKIIYTSMITVPKEIISSIFIDPLFAIHPAFKIAAISAISVFIVLLVVGAFLRWKV